MLEIETGIWRSVHWFQLAVGDLVLLENRADVPADMLIVGTHEPDPGKNVSSVLVLRCQYVPCCITLASLCALHELQERSITEFLH